MKKIPSGLWARGLSLAKLSAQSGKQLAESTLKQAFGADAADTRRELLSAQAKILAEQLGQLKGSVMKVGQMLSMYGEHFLPPEANAFLKTLQFKSPPLEWKTIEEQLRKELGTEKLSLLEIDPTPLASASLGQVHRATIRESGQKIALKVQYPGVEQAIQSDLKTLKGLFAMLQLLPNLPQLEHIFEEISTMLWQELDYRRELELTDRFRNLFKEVPGIRIPQTFPEFSSQRILATEFEEGSTVDSAEVQALSQDRRDRLGHLALDVYYRELFLYGQVQTDPHLGNYRIRISEDGNDQLVLFDFGAVREFSRDFVQSYKKLIRSSLQKDRSGIHRAALELRFSRGDDPEELQKIFADFCLLMIEPFTFPDIAPDMRSWFDDEGRYDFRGSDLPRRLTNEVTKIFGFRLNSPPREVVFLDRKTGGVFIFLSVLGARINARQRLEGFLKN